MSEMTRFLLFFLGADAGSGSVAVVGIAAELSECFFFFRFST
jgi:hypothetical protein